MRLAVLTAGNSQRSTSFRQARALRQPAFGKLDTVTALMTRLLSAPQMVCPEMECAIHRNQAIWIDSITPRTSRSYRLAR
jgi:hypothetical protein